MRMFSIRSWWRRHSARDATPAELVCEVCRDLRCTGEQARTCAIHLAVVQVGRTAKAGLRVGVRARGKAARRLAIYPRGRAT
jgi:hypothetical protein